MATAIDKHLLTYNKFKRSCLMDGVLDKDVPILWLAYRIECIHDSVLLTGRYNAHTTY